MTTGDAETQPIAIRASRRRRWRRPRRSPVPSLPSVDEAQPSPSPPVAGTLIAVSSSPGWTAVMNTPWKNSSSGPSVRRSAPRDVSSEPGAAISGGRWFVGSLEQRFPPTVPRFRTWTSAIVRATSREDRPPGRNLCRARSLERRWPSRRSRARLRPVDPAQLLDPVQVDDSSGAATRAFITFTRHCPPASARASSREARSRRPPPRPRPGVFELPKQHRDDPITQSKEQACPWNRRAEMRCSEGMRPLAVLLAALALVPAAGSKEGVVARLENPAVLQSAAGAKVTLLWTLRGGEGAVHCHWGSRAAERADAEAPGQCEMHCPDGSAPG